MVQPQLEIVSTTWHGLEAVELHDDGTVLATIVLRGATPLSWRPTTGELSWEALDGYLDAEDLHAQSGVRGGIMAPFCNRITDARYTFAGTEHDLRPGAQDRLIYHGLTREMDFTLSSAQVRDGAAHLVLDCRELGRGGTPGYPFPVDVQVTYAISRTGLAISVSGTNTGPSAAPFAMGWHPYLAFPARQVDALDSPCPGRLARAHRLRPHPAARRGRLPADRGRGSAGLPPAPADRRDRVRRLLDRCRARRGRRRALPGARAGQRRHAHALAGARARARLHR
ncbi:aldose 1-epimerase [Salana multivorans]